MCMMTGKGVLCFILFLQGLIAGEVLYYCKNDTVILECDKLSNISVIWKGPANSLLYAIGGEINPSLESKRERLSIIHDNPKQFDLKIERFSREDEGNYRCVRGGSQTTIKVKIFDLKMARIPSNLSVEREDNKHKVYGFLNHPLNLTCKVIHGIPEETLQWTINNETVKEGKTTLTYQIMELQMIDHMKNYTCVVSNNFTKYTLEHTVHLFVYMPPKVSIPNGKQINIREGNDMTLFCIYESNHEITQLKWKRKLKDQGNREDMGVNSTLVIKDIKRQEAGLYTCTVTNRAGNESDYISVVVQYPPTVSFKFEETEYSRKLECIPKGIPDRYSFNQWEHKSEYLEHIRFLHDNDCGKLVMPFESGETDRHHDKGIYICNVSNNVSFSNKRFISANYFLNASGNPYYVTSNNKTQYCSVRRTCNISVDFVSFPAVTNISIIFNTTLIIKTNYVLEDTKAMDTVYDKNISVKACRLTVFLDVETKEDYGLYTVVVKNSIGKENFSVLLKSASRPEAPKILQWISTEKQIDLKWHSGFDGGYLQSFVIQYRRHDVHNWHQIEVTDSYADAMSINGLEAGTEYQVRMFATNVLGDSDFTDQILIMTDEADSMAYLGLFLLVIPFVALGAALYLYHKEGYISRLAIIRCCKWHTFVNDGVANHYNDSGINYHDKSTVNQSLTLHGDKKTSDELNYIEVYFEPKPKERQFKIHGIEKKTNYVEIDFSKKACALAYDSDSDDDSAICEDGKE